MTAPHRSEEDRLGIVEFTRRIAQRIRATLTIPERILISTWVERNIYLPNDTSPGKSGKIKLFEFQREPLDAMGDTSLREVVIIKSIRVGVTLLMCLAMAYCVRHLQQPSSFVTLNVEKAKEFVKSFWEPLFSRRKSNRNRILKEIRRHFVKGEKQDQWSDWYFLNGAIGRIRAAGSNDSFRGYASKIAFGDEVDGENWAPGKESSKIELYRGRTQQFDDGRIVLASSPTNAASSNINGRFIHTDQRRRYVPCPYCSGVYDAPHESRDHPNRMAGWQVLRFGDGTTPYGIKFKIQNHVAIQATYACDHCGKEIEEVTRDGYSWKEWMDRHGRWVPTNGSWMLVNPDENIWEAITQELWVARKQEILASWDAGIDLVLTNGIYNESHDDETGEVSLEPIYTTAMPGHRGYHIWSAYSQAPGVTWLSIANIWLSHKRDGRTGIQTFNNLHLGEAWEPSGVFMLPNESELSSVTVPYDAEVPIDVVGLTMGVDVQPLGRLDGSERPRLECSVYGHGRRRTAYLIGHWVIDAPWPSQAAEMALDTLIQRKFKRSDGREFPILATCIDSGTATQDVYDYCQRRARWNVFAVKGAKEEGGVKKDYGIVSNMASTNKETGHTWYMVSTLTAKEELAYKLDVGPQIEGIFFPHSAIRAGNGRFFAGLVAERSVTNSRTGRIEWKRRGQLTGEPLDCFVYAMAARELARRKYAPFRDLDRAADYLKAPEEPSLVTVDRRQQDHSAQAEMMAGVIGSPAVGERVAMPVKRHRAPIDFTVNKRPRGSGRGGGRGGWGRF